MAAIEQVGDERERPLPQDQHLLPLVNTLLSVQDPPWPGLRSTTPLVLCCRCGGRTLEGAGERGTHFLILLALSNPRASLWASSKVPEIVKGRFQLRECFRAFVPHPVPFIPSRVSAVRSSSAVVTQRFPPPHTGESTPALSLEACLLRHSQTFWEVFTPVQRTKGC